MKKGSTIAVFVIMLALLAFSAKALFFTKDAPPPAQEAKQSNQPANPAPSTQTTAKYSSPPAMSISPDKQYTAVVKTSQGNFKIKLFNKEAPVTVNNFVFLSRDGFYKGVTFHRIIKEFMVQTGDPLGTGAGGPGYKFADELNSKMAYSQGIVAMANSGPNTNGSQFFICTGDQARNLDQAPNYTIFGQVIEGMDVIQKIAATPVEADARGELSKPKEKVTINEIVIEENGKVGDKISG